MHCPFLLQDTDSFRYGFSDLRRHAEECLTQLYMSQNPPCQELVSKDLHGTEWHFWHIFRGQPKRYLLTTGWSVFVSSKRLVARDAFCWPDWISNSDLELPEGSLALGPRPFGLNGNVMTCFYNDTPLPFIAKGTLICYNIF